MVSESTLLDQLEEQRAAIAEQWYREISRTSGAALSADEARQQLEELVGRALPLLLSEPFRAAEAQEIGGALARLHYLQPEGLGLSLAALGAQFTDGLQAEQLRELFPNLLLLLQEMSAGFLTQAYQTVLSEQEAIRGALVQDLRETERALRESQAQLELRVEERTAELARANKELTLEIAERTRAEEALQESEEKYRELLENINDVIYTVDAEGFVTYTSPSVEALLGYRPAELLGRKVTDFVHPQDQAVFRSAFVHLLSGQGRQSEYRIVAKSGEVRSVRTSSRAVVHGGRVTEVHGVLSDVTERRQAEAALRESEARYRSVVEDQTELICRFRPDGSLLFTNQAFRRCFGRPSHESARVNCLSLVCGQDEARCAGILGSLDPDNQVATLEHQWTNAEGLVVWLQWTLRASFDAAGQMVELQAVGRDITERKHAEEALRESEERWRSLVENAPDFIVTLDGEGRILFMNQIAEGGDLSLDEVIGTKLVDYVVPEHATRLEESINRVFASGESQYTEAATIAAGGRRRWYAATIGAIRGDDGVAAALLITREITERKRIDEIKDNLIRDVSHELRTPLAKAQMSLELLSELLEAEPVDRERIRRVSYLGTSNIQRLLQTVEGMLDLSQLEAGVSPYERGRVRLDLLIHEVLEFMTPLAENKGLALVAEVSAGLPEIVGDREKLFRVLLNVVDNAIKFSGDGEIVVSAHGNEHEAVITVKDSGEGILAENVDRVFERFFQEKTRYDGVGVGLSICKAIVEGHDGRIWAESPGRGQGATFGLALPTAGGDTVRP